MNGANKEEPTQDNSDQLPIMWGTLVANPPARGSTANPPQAHSWHIKFGALFMLTWWKHVQQFSSVKVVTNLTTLHCVDFT